jgi:hypothetical protein
VPKCVDRNGLCFTGTNAVVQCYEHSLLILKRGKDRLKLRFQEHKLFLKLPTQRIVLDCGCLHEVSRIAWPGTELSVQAFEDTPNTLKQVDVDLEIVVHLQRLAIVAQAIELQLQEEIPLLSP